MMAERLSNMQLKRLSEHKYSSEGTSVFEPTMQIFWRWLITKTPTTIAPNTLTIAGLIVNVVTALIVILYSPDAKQYVAPWVYILAALGMFIYQTLDALDGKQARRTNTNSPMGELFDHGCDSISTVFVTLSTSVATHLGEHPAWLFFQCFSMMFLFYLAHWQSYVTGSLKFKWVDVTELQLMVMGVFIVNVFADGSFWMYNIYGTPLNLWIAYFCLIMGIGQAYSNLSIIVMQGGIGKNRSTCAGTSTIFPLFPIMGVIVTAIVISQKSPSLMFQHHPTLYLLSFGLVLAKITNSLIVAHMTKSEMSFWDSIYLGPAMLFLNQYFNCVIDEYIVLWMCCVYCIYNMTTYAYIITTQICDYLNIYCFCITSQPRQTNGTKKS